MTEAKTCAGRYGCGELRWIEEFRLLTNGSRATYCHDCELQFDKFRKGYPSTLNPAEVPSGLLPNHVSVV